MAAAPALGGTVCVSIRRFEFCGRRTALAETVAGEFAITRGSGRRWNEMIGIPPIAGPSSTESSVTPTGGRDAGYASAPPKATTIPS